MQRVEIITGKERRRHWSSEDKVRLVAEAFASGAVVAHVARRYGIAESCLYTWRKQLEGARTGAPWALAAPPELIPVAVDTGASRPERAVPLQTPPAHALITFPDGTRLEIAADYPVTALKALVAAVRGQP